MRDPEPDAGGDLDGDLEGHGPDQLARPPGGLRRDCTVQLPRHDPSLDVPYRCREVGREEVGGGDIFFMVERLYISKLF